VLEFFLPRRVTILLSFLSALQFYFRRLVEILALGATLAGPNAQARF
jgi:hypothetical protein